MTECNDADMAKLAPMRRASALAVVLGCLIIITLLALGLWMTSRLAKSVSQESRQKAFAMSDAVAESVQEGMAEALQENEEAEPETKVETSPSPDQAEIPLAQQWTTQVNEFLTREVLGAGISADSPDRSPTLDETLHQAALKLDTGMIEHPAVEAAIRTTLAKSFLGLNKLEDAVWQGEFALESLVKGFGEHHSYTSQAVRNLGALRIGQQRFDDAVELFQRLYDLRIASSGLDDPEAREIVDFVRRLKLSDFPGSSIQQESDSPSHFRTLMEQTPPSCAFKALEF